MTITHRGVELDESNKTMIDKMMLKQMAFTL